jgi:hypothetical protein
MWGRCSIDEIVRWAGRAWFKHFAGDAARRCALRSGIIARVPAHGDRAIRAEPERVVDARHVSDMRAFGRPLAPPPAWRESGRRNTCGAATVFRMVSDALHPRRQARHGSCSSDAVVVQRLARRGRQPGSTPSPPGWTNRSAPRQALSRTRRGRGDYRSRFLSPPPLRLLSVVGSPLTPSPPRDSTPSPPSGPVR